MKQLFQSISVLALLLSPALAFAQGGGIEVLIVRFGQIVGIATPIVAGLALLVFLWGLVKFIVKADDEEARTQGRQFMVWGVVALFVMASLWGIIFFIGFSLGIDTSGGSLPVPCFEGLPGCGAGNTQSPPPPSGVLPPPDPGGVWI